MRLIDADALLLRIGCHGTNKFGMLDEDIREYISKQPTIDPEIVQLQWIPVTERLPEKLVPVLIQHTYMEWAGISIGYITTDGYWEWFGYFMGDDMLHHPPGDGLICPGSKYVNAWMPLPEPYTAKAEDDDNARRVKPPEFDRFKNDTLKDAQPTTPAHWEKADIPLPYQMRTVPTPSRTVAHREMYVCSACGEYGEQNTRYCPHCGARMDEEENNETD